jgi:hypothetical protein
MDAPRAQARGEHTDRDAIENAAGFAVASHAA